ncbi:MAG: succinylglutamate desuccinylase/aspartoacylase family protein [Spirochaetaceae bacterium]|nr:succinylglutamate desuccinylase/aspartoacylase family protein [Spirochaetaceae bacterium]
MARGSVPALCLALLWVSLRVHAEPTNAHNAPSPAPGAGILRHDLRPGPGVSRLLWLSEYEPSLRFGPGDARVYILDSGLAGATLLVVGGAHANEIAGTLAAALVVERAIPTQGRLVVVPNVNSSGSSYVDPSDPQPSWVRMDAASGVRYFKYGARFVHPEHQGEPDPERFQLPFSAETLDGQESRNLNRAYPGQVDGTLTQRLAAAIMELIRREGVDIAVDLHEAAPGSNVAWTIIANPKNLGTAVDAVFDLDDGGIPMGLDKSSEEFRGLSHREWGDHTAAQAFLVETVNPAQDKAVVEPVDQLGHPEFPLWRRVAVDLEAISALVRSYNASSRGGILRFGGVPGFAELRAAGLEPFF